ncbi:unnamed protein product [Rotaria sordida]|uniref:RRM domain-containing protein n=1 Tax=Rotaria sordida TaxID=392033 RepID=A0A814AXX5_9BILA|nr:unnamed protein product [Rotaria sordida]CAF0920224.1 unnamed protein product [Rotaria sordida]CAF0923408.1 unnamed protein product [Rotaria sordida]
MSNELFVDGICEIDDTAIQSYFSRFGSRIINYESHRHRPTNSCCFALISFVSHHTVNAILRQRPHSIDLYPLFVKRLLPPSVCSFIERLLPVSSIFVYNKLNKQFDEQKLKNYFNNFGHILKFEHDYVHNRLLIEYDDYDSVDKIFLNKEHLPKYMDIHKNILPYAQNTIEYHGICHLKQQGNTTIDGKKKKRNHKKKNLVNGQYQDLLQKTIENLINCKAQLKNKENDYVILQMEYVAIKEKADELDQLLNEQNQTVKSCLSCKEHEVTISRLQQTLIKLNKQYDTIKSQYQRLLSTQYTPIGISKSKHEISAQHRQYSLSTRLNNNENFKNKDSCLSQSNLSTLGSCDIVMKQQNSSMPIIRSPIQQYQTTYKCNFIKSDKD